MMSNLNQKILKISSATKVGMAVVSIIIGMLSNILYYYMLPPESAKTLVSPSIVSHVPYIPQLLTMTNDLGKLEITYDKELTISETGTVKFKLVTPIFSGLTKENTKPLKVALSGPDISISPEINKEFTADDIINDRAEWSWSYRPKSAGPNQLEFIFTNLPFDNWYKPSVNRKSYKLSNPIILPLTVNSLSGMSPQVDYFIKLIGGVVVFILMYPLLISFLHKYFGLVKEG